MCRRFAIESLELLEVLEQKLSMSSFLVGATHVVVDDPYRIPNPIPETCRPTNHQSWFADPPSGPVGPG